ncbi:MAG TPA: S46 family peptidase [Gemmatimonadales bacterium]|nr:S46 family peptidase [Gemmatimonadales bacterium]
MRRFVVVAALAGLTLAARPARSQEYREYPGLETGKMWTFDVPPLDYWARRYEFRPSAEWLEHVRMATARQPGCTASFVSDEGLVMTNHHCARACIEGVTGAGEDLLERGFYARTRAEERPCPNFTLDQLIAITDVTDSIARAVPETAAAGEAARRRTEAIQALERRCAAQGEGLFCQVVTMYRGGQYKLYRFRRYTDVRLVFAVESQMAFFGGDPDNFTYPRHDLDVSFYRAYDRGQPLRTTHFTWSTAGAREGDLVFVIGNPGSTGRLNTMAQLEYLRDVQYPAQLAQLADQIAVYHEVGRLDEQRRTALRNTLFGAENTQKAVRGYQSGLLNERLMARKRAWESEFRGRVAASADLQRRFGAAWDEIAGVRRELAGIDARRRFHSFNAYGSRLLNLAGFLVRYHAEMAKPDADRLPPFREANRVGLERALFDGPPVDTVLDRRLFAAWLRAMAQALPDADPVRRAALGGRTPDEVAAAMVAGTSIMSGDARKALVDGGAAAVAASRDPFVALARVIDPLERAVQARVTELTNRETQQDELVARALLAVYGSSVAPDATFSLRISDGEVKRYPANGTLIQPFTTFYGLFDRWAGYSGQAPWNLPPRWLERRAALDLATPLNAVSTNDIIGGNSGSPVINRERQIVGLIFDGNIEMLPNRFLFTEEVSRSVWVDGRGIIEALRKVYEAGPLADELVGGRE